MAQTSNRKKTKRACCRQLDTTLSPDLFRALGDPNRLTILVRLAGSDEPQTVSEIASCCPVDLSVVSRHLATLRQAGVLEARREGKQVFYEARLKPLADLLRQIADALDGCCQIEPNESNPGEAR